MKLKKNRIDLRKHFLTLQRQMREELRTKRGVLKHPGTKGDATEVGWRKWLDKYIPKRYVVDKAFVVDSTGAISDQIDIVIFDAQYTSFLLNEDGAKYVPAESVYAVLEVKQELNAQTLVYAAAKAASVRRLHRTTAPIAHAGGTYPPKQPFRIPAGILALDTPWKTRVAERITAALRPLNPESQLDLGCILEAGAFDATYSANEPVRVTVSPAEQSQISFFLNLLARLQSLGTVPAIDLPKYADALRKSP